MHKNVSQLYWFVRASTPLGSNMQKAHALRERFAIFLETQFKIVDV